MAESRRPFSGRVYRNRSITSRNLDERLSTFHKSFRLGSELSWVRTIRDALGMSVVDLAMRMGVSHSRVSQIERAERARTINLSTLDRAARALNCHVVCFLSPDEPLEHMVWRQAYLKAVEQIGDRSRDYESEELRTPLGEATYDDEVEALAYSLVNARGLWR